MRAFRHRTLGAAASIAVALGVFMAEAPVQAQSPAENASYQPASTQSSSNWQASDDDFLFLQLVIQNYKLTYDVRGYQTDRGICLDLADVIQSLDLPIRIDKSRAAQLAGCSRRTRNSRSIATPGRYKT